MHSVWEFLLIATCSIVTVIECSQQSECAQKNSLFNPNLYNLRMNQPQIRYLNHSDGSITITNTLTYEAQVKHKFMNNLCLQNYCYEKLNLNRASRGYLYNPHYGWFKFFSQKVKWIQGFITCIDDGGHLAIPTSIRLKNYLLKMIKDNKQESAWMGVHDVYEDGLSVDVTDKPFHHLKVFETSDENSPTKACYRLTSSGNGVFTLCPDFHPFICQIYN